MPQKKFENKNKKKIKILCRVSELALGKGTSLPSARLAALGEERPAAADHRRRRTSAAAGPRSGLPSPAGGAPPCPSPAPPPDVDPPVAPCPGCPPPLNRWSGGEEKQGSRGEKGGGGEEKGEGRRRREEKEKGGGRRREEEEPRPPATPLAVHPRCRPRPSLETKVTPAPRRPTPPPPMV